MTNSSDERGAELRDLFYETSQELLQALNDQALKLEKTPGDEEIVRAIRRTVHTLKGDSAACGLRELSALAHQFEDALSLEGAATQAAVAEIAFAAADVFTAMIAAYHTGTKLPNTTQLSKRIEELTSAPTAKKTRRRRSGSASEVKTGTSWTEHEKLSMAKAQAAGLALFHIVAKLDPDCAMPIAGRQLMHNAIAGVGQVLAVRPDVKSPAASKQVEFMLGSGQTAEQIAAKCKIPTIAEEVTVELMAAATPVQQPPSPTPGVEGSGAIEESRRPADGFVAEQAGSADPAASPQMPVENILRVEAVRIDSVLNLV